MGLDIDTSTLIHEWIGVHAITGPLLTLGVQNADFTWAQFCAATSRQCPQHDPRNIPTAQELMRTSGIPETFSLDISDYEGADFLFDLNNDMPPPHLASRFGAVLNGGTIEHVFNLPHALTASTRMLQPGGVIIHIVPVHGWIDHGFYQISPTLLFDYYAAARFEILESAGVIFAAGRDQQRHIIPAPPGALVGSAPELAGGSVLHMFAARKTAGSLDEVAPTQSVYARDPVYPPATLRWFPPYSSVGGVRSGGECEKWVLGPFRPEEGLAWVAALPRAASEGDTLESPSRSRLALFEDDRLLGPAHAAHALVRQRGGGCYSHWHGTVLLSSSDGSDPNANGRLYTAVLPRRCNAK